MTSVAPSAKPIGAMLATSVRTPGEDRAPRRWRSCVSADGRKAREAGAVTSTSVPASANPPATRSATAGEPTLTIAAVSRGPPTNTISMPMPSTA